MKTGNTKLKAFEFVSDKPATLPAACAKCGKPTKKLMAVKVSVGRPNFVGDFMQGMFGGHITELMHSFQTLKAGSVPIPCCHDCRGPYYWGNFIALVCLVGGGCGFYFSVNSNLPLWALFLTVIPSIACFLLWVIPHQIGKSKALPVLVWLEGSRFHYLLAGGAYQEALSVAVNNQQTIFSRPPKHITKA